MLEAQVRDEVDRDGAYEEGFVAVVACVFDFQHDIGGEQPGEVEGVGAVEEPAGGAQAQAADPDGDETADVVGDLAAVPDLVHDGDRGGLEVFQTGIGGPHAGGERLAGEEIPAGLLITPGQGGGQDLGEGFIGLERGEEQGPEQVGVGLQREPGAFGAGGGFERVNPGRRLAEVAGPDADDLGAGEAGGHQLVFGLGGFDDQPWDPVTCRGFEQRADGLDLPEAGAPGT